MVRYLRWLASLLWPPVFGLITVLILVCGVLYGVLGIVDRAHYRGEVRSCIQKVDSLSSSLTVFKPDGTLGWRPPRRGDTFKLR